MYVQAVRTSCGELHRFPNKCCYSLRSVDFLSLNWSSMLFKVVGVLSTISRWPIVSGGQKHPSRWHNRGWQHCSIRLSSCRLSLSKPSTNMTKKRYFFAPLMLVLRTNSKFVSALTPQTALCNFSEQCCRVQSISCLLPWQVPNFVI